METKTLIFEDKIPANKEAFKEKVIKIANDLKIDPNWLMMVFWKESKFDHKIQNKDTRATGLIQIRPETAKGLGTTVDALKSMSNVEQLDYVYKYYYPYRNYITKAEDLYLITFYPNADKKHAGTLSKPDDWVFPNHVYLVNKGVDVNKDGKLTIADVRQWFWKDIPVNVVKDFKLDEPVSVPVAAFKFVNRNIYFILMGAVLIGVGTYFLLSIIPQNHKGA